MKTSASRSSGIALTSSSSSGSSASRPSSSAFRWNVRSRRILSMARFRAVVTIQAAGFAGTPSLGQRSAARTNASWTASSASSKSPRTRMRIETARLHSSRNALAIASMRRPPTRCDRRSDGSPVTRTRRRVRAPQSESPRPGRTGRRGMRRRSAPSSRQTGRR